MPQRRFPARWNAEDAKEYGEPATSRSRMRSAAGIGLAARSASSIAASASGSEENVGIEARAVKQDGRLEGAESGQQQRLRAAYPWEPPKKRECQRDVSESEDYGYPERSRKLAGNEGFQRHTQDRIHGYRIGYFVAGGVPGSFGKTYPLPGRERPAELK